MKKRMLLLVILGLFVVSSTALADGRFTRYYNGPVMEPIYDNGPFDSHYNHPSMDPIYDDGNPIDRMHNDPALEPIPTAGPVDRQYNAPVLSPKYEVEYRDGMRSRFVRVKSKKVAE